MPVPYCLDDYSFVVELEVWDCDASSFDFFFNITFLLFRVFCGSIQVLGLFSSSEKNAGVILIGITLNMLIALGSINILTVFVLPIHEHGIFFSNFGVFPNFFHKLSVVFSV